MQIHEHADLQGMAQLYGPVNYVGLAERLTPLLSTCYLLSEVSVRTVLHDDADRVAVREACLVR